MFGGKRRAKPPKPAAAADCFFCRRQIALGESYVSLNSHVERTGDGHTINVEQAGLLLATCISCAPAPAAIVDALRTHRPGKSTQLQ